MDNDTTNKQPEKQKDESLENLERMLEKLPENARKPILDLINKRKVELGLLKSELKPLGYKLKKGRSKAWNPFEKLLRILAGSKKRRKRIFMMWMSKMNP
jgi:hypothetical protein